MSGYAGELERFALELRRVRRALRSLPRELEQRERDVMADEDLTTEARRIKLRQIRDEERSRQQKLHGRLAAASERAAEVATKIRSLRPVEETAQTRLRDLLARGHAYDQILERAVENADDELVAALRWEAMYHGNGSRFADARSTVEACDRALAQVGRGGEQDNNQAILEVSDASRGLEEIGEFAAKSVLGEATPHDRLRLAYAVGPGEDGGD
jgi:hypothetical protein